jgi:hypothetical protein
MENAVLVMAANLKSYSPFLIIIFLAVHAASSFSGKKGLIRPKQIFFFNIKKGIKNEEFYADFKSGKQLKKCLPKKGYNSKNFVIMSKKDYLLSW